jgi:ABC-type transport system substrate-binding protein
MDKQSLEERLRNAKPDYLNIDKEKILSQTKKSARMSSRNRKTITVLKSGIVAASGMAAAAALFITIPLHSSSYSTHGANGETSANAMNERPREGGSIVLDESQGPKDLDPALAYDTQSWEIVQQLNDQLVTYQKGTNNTKIVPMDAKSWTVSSDKRTYTFHLRSGLKFWNGTPVTAQNYIDEIQRIATKKLGSGGEWLIENIVGEQDFYKGKAKKISGLSAPDAHTLVITLTKPTAVELERLAMPFFSPVDPKFIKKVGSKVFDSTKAMGDGAFKLQTINSNEAVLVKNPDYWMTDSNGKKLPYLNKVTIRVNRNTQVDALNFEKGTTAFLGLQQGIPSSAFPTFEDKPRLKKLVHKVPQNSVFYLGLNNNIAPFNNKTVRQAMEYAINKKSIVKLMNGRAIAANQPLPPNVPGHQKTLPVNIRYKYDPSKAKQLLKKAGVDPTKLTLTLYSSNSPDQMKEDQSIQSDLEKIGINVKLKATTWSTFLDVTQKGKAQMFCIAWVQDYPDAGDFLMLFESSQAPVNNSSMYKNKQVDQWLRQASSITNQQQRLQLFNKVTNQVMEDAPWVPLYYPIAYYATQSWVHGWFAPAAKQDPLRYVWIDKGYSQS